MPKKPKKYKIVFLQTKTLYVEIEAPNKQKSTKLATNLIKEENSSTTNPIYNKDLHTSFIYCEEIKNL